MKKLRVGVIGVGMGRHHVKEFQKHPNCEVVALADIDKARLSQMSKELEVETTYLSAEKMLEKESLDVCSVVTPNKFHCPLSIAALEAGCHVLCDKPPAMNAEEARLMADAAKAADRRLMINFSFRFAPPSWFLKKQVDQGVLGQVYFGRTSWLRRRGLPGFGGWFGQKAVSGGGPLIDLGVHRLDFALWLMGFPKPVWAMGATYNHIGRARARQQKKAFDVEDLAVGMIKFENGAVLELEASWAGNIKERELMETRILGTEGGLLHRNLDEGYRFDAEVFFEKDGQQCDLRPHDPIPSPGSAMTHFADCILNDEPHTATGEEGVMVMQILDAVYESANKGEPVKVS